MQVNFESSKEWSDFFSKLSQVRPKHAASTVLKATRIETPLAPMIAIADEKGLYALEFINRRSLKPKLERLRKKLKSDITWGENTILKSIALELKNYFKGKNLSFKTPLHFVGSAFQISVWQELKKIPPNKTRSYLDIAKKIGRPTACRAVAQANGSNQLAIIIPCHRVIRASGELGGYSSGVPLKEWLLAHEKKFD